MPCTPAVAPDPEGSRKRTPAATPAAAPAPSRTALKVCWDFTSLAHPSSCARVPPPLIWLWVLDAFEKNNAPPPTSATAVPAETQAHVREAREAAGTVDDVAPSGTWRAEAGVA